MLCRIFDDSTFTNLAFANLKHFLDGRELTASADTADEDWAAVAEYVAGASDHKPYRIKLYDKKAALDAIARVLDMLPKTGAHENDDVAEAGVDHDRNQIFLWRGSLDGQCRGLGQGGGGEGGEQRGGEESVLHGGPHSKGWVNIATQAFPPGTEPL